MDVQNATVPEPLIPMACAPDNPVWSTFWGPKIYCTAYDQLHMHTIDRMDDDYTYNSTTETFMCNLQSANKSTFVATFKCSIVEHFQQILNSTVQKVTECVYNTSVVISNVLNPVSEISLVLPRRFDGITDAVNDSSFVRSDYNSSCSIYQVLNCRSVNVNNSLYENDLIDVVNSSLMEPVKCFLTYKYFNDPVSIINHSFDSNTSTDLINVIETNEPPKEIDWSFLFVIIFIIAGGVGNILVCLAVALDRKLQNVTNYFLFSLAIADLLVSLFVMPFGAIQAFLGKHSTFLFCGCIVKID